MCIDLADAHFKVKKEPEEEKEVIYYVQPTEDGIVKTEVKIEDNRVLFMSNDQGSNVGAADSDTVNCRLDDQIDLKPEIDHYDSANGKTNETIKSEREPNIKSEIHDPKYFDDFVIEPSSVKDEEVKMEDKGKWNQIKIADYSHKHRYQFKSDI